MFNNGPLAVSADGKNVTNATGKDIIFNTKYPFHKLDSTKPESFRIIQLFLSKETPNPTPPTGGTGRNSTLVYQLPHGYNYVPSTWFLLSLDNFNTTIGPEGSVISGYPVVPFSYCTLDVQVDSTNINFYVNKVYTDGAPTPPTNIGITVYIRSYIFVEDLTGTDLPSQA